MEYLIYTAPEVEFSLPTKETIMVSAEFVTLDSNISLDINETGDMPTVTLPYLDANSTGKLIWKFVVNGRLGQREDEVQIITPYLSDKETLAIMPEGSESERKEIEASVRAIINSYCNQSFGRSVKTLVVNGKGETALALPERILSISSMATLNSNLDVSGVIISGEGWYLKKKWLDTIGPLYKNDSSYWNGNERPGGIIYAPTATRGPTEWERDYPFTITGEWGWYSVPQAVNQAAKLLFNDYACIEVGYRDKYLNSIKAADWRLEFDSNAWSRTGNVRADQLLSDYVILNWGAL